MSISNVGKILRVNGPVVEIDGLKNVATAELVEVGPDRLPGEAVTIREGIITTQVYAYTGGLAPGDSAYALGRPLSVALGPGLLGGVFDGTMRRLDSAGEFLETAGAPQVKAARAWTFTPRAAVGDDLRPGALLGVIQETPVIEHRLLVPPGASGRLTWIAVPGDHSVDDRLATVGKVNVGFSNHWPVRKPRPVAERLPAASPLVTGQRVLDLL